MNLVSPLHIAHASAVVATAIGPAEPPSDFLHHCLALDLEGRIREAGRAHGQRLGGQAIREADWRTFADTWIEVFMRMEAPVGRAQLAEALGGVLDAVEPPGTQVGERVFRLVDRFFGRWPEEPPTPVARAEAVACMLDLVHGVVEACGGPGLDPASLQRLLVCLEPSPQALAPHDARRWLDAQDLSHVTQAVATDVGGLHASAANRRELLAHVLAEWRPGEQLHPHIHALVAGLGGVHMDDDVRLELLEGLLGNVNHSAQDMDPCLWLVGGDPDDFAGSVAQVLRAAGPILPVLGVRLVRGLAAASIERDEALEVLPVELARAAAVWPRSLAVELGAACGSALRLADQDEVPFALWLEAALAEEVAEGPHAHRDAVALGLRAARDPLVVWDAPGFTPSDRMALLERIFAQSRLMAGPVASRCLARTLALDATPAQRRALLLALFTRAYDHLLPEACSQARLVLSRDMAVLDEDEQRASLDTIATIMEIWGWWARPLTQARELNPDLRGWRDATLEWHERVRLELAGPPGSLEYPQVAERLANFLRDLMEQLADALTRWDQAAAAVPPAVWDAVAEEAEEA